MISTKDVQFIEKADKDRPNVTHILGGIQICYEVSVDEIENGPREILYDHIRLEIWRRVYGDLKAPLLELQSYALRDVRPENSHRVLELCEQLTALLGGSNS